MSCNGSIQTISFVGTVNRCTNSGTQQFPITFTMRDVTGFATYSKVIDGGASEVVTPSPSPANLLIVQAEGEVDVILNGGAEKIRVSNSLVLTGSVTSIEVFNDVAATPQDVLVEIYTAQGTI